MPNPQVPWYLDEEFWKKTESFVFGIRSDQATKVETQLVVKEIGPPPARVLDLCCGMGRHSVELAAMGYEVTGVDASPHLLSRARQRAKAASVNVDWVLGDARSFNRKEMFDAVICMYSSFGQFADEASDRSLLEVVYAALEDCGVAIIDVFGKEVLARLFVSRDWVEDERGRLLLRRRSVQENWTRIENEWILLEDGLQTRFRMHQRLYDAQELSLALTTAGLTVEKVFGGFDGRPYDLSAQRLIALARK